MLRPCSAVCCITVAKGDMGATSRGCQPTFPASRIPSASGPCALNAVSYEQQHGGAYLLIRGLTTGALGNIPRARHAQRFGASALNAASSDQQHGRCLLR